MAQSKPIKIREVWYGNLIFEFELIAILIHDFPYISMDTKFPVANDVSLNLIQLGLTLSDVNGNLPDFGGCESCPLLSNMRDFMVTRWFFGDNVYDLPSVEGGLYGGLKRVAVWREVGKSHQAGSDSFLTWHAFQKITDLYFIKGGAAKHAGVLYGLEVS
ncbi:hypothetical protein Leryth_012108 [Lithospermum erythrorhizon]|nr:hypothetical protein Leryth_012108 [Lithospermum erythrorhizon]